MKKVFIIAAMLLVSCASNSPPVSKAASEPTSSESQVCDEDPLCQPLRESITVVLPLVYPEEKVKELILGIIEGLDDIIGDDYDGFPITMHYVNVVFVSDSVGLARVQVLASDIEIHNAYYIVGSQDGEWDLMGFLLMRNEEGFQEVRRRMIIESLKERAEEKNKVEDHRL